jgi:AcrR family transcriptional regulator
LLAAAEQLFGVRGYDGTSIVDLTQAAKIALGTFYLYFPDKKALFVELVDSLGIRLREHVAMRAGGASDRLEAERLSLLAFLEFVAKHRHLYRIVRQADFVDQRCFRRYYDRMAKPYASGLKAAAARGEIRRGNPEVMAYCLMGVADFIGMRFGLWETKPSPAVIAEALAFTRGGLVPASPATRKARRTR